MFPNLTYAPASILERGLQNTSPMDGQGRVTEKNCCCQQLICQSQVTQRASRDTLGGGRSSMSPAVPCEGALAPALLELSLFTAGRVLKLAWGLLSLTHSEPFGGSPTRSASRPLLNTWTHHLHCHNK